MEDDSNKQENNDVKEVVNTIVQEEKNDDIVSNDEKSKKENNNKSGFFYEMWEKYKAFVKDYILTNIMIWILAFASQLYEFIDGSSAENYGYCLLGIGLSAGWMFLVETFKKKKEDRLAFYICGFLAAVTSTLLLRMYQDDDYFEYLAIGMLGFYSALSLIVIYRLYVDSKLKWGKFVLTIIGNSFIAGIVQSIVSVGIMLISAILFQYVLEGLFSDTLELYVHEMVLLATLVAPSLSIYALTNTKTKVEYNLIELLYAYVVTPIITIAIVLLYLYILRITLLRELAATAMSAIIFGLFIPTYFVWVICSHTKEERTLVNKIAKKLPYLFIPLVLLQVYGLFLRINQYGFTIARYLGIMALILEVFAIALTIYKEEKYIGRVLWVAAALLIISFCVPYINAYSVEALSQSNRLKKLMPEGTSFRELSKEDRKSARSIYYTLKYSEIGKKYIPDYIQDQDNTIQNYNTYDDSFWNDEYYNYKSYDNYDTVTNTIQEI